MSLHVSLIAPAISPALREARFGETETETDHGSGDESNDGSDDDGLDATGLRQAEAVRETFPRATALYASPTRRCRRTAQALGLTTAPLAALAPCAMGRWQGRTLDEVAAAEPQSVAAWLSDPEAAPHGGESLSDFHTRVAHWLDTAGEAHSDGTTEAAGPTMPPATGRRLLVVAEPDFIRAATVHALGAPARTFWRIDVRPLSVTELSGRDGRWNLRLGRPLHE
ncbi:histidine phosphatase family protein [Streptomyces paludis]|uniref:Histidine phosphatase family protein n=1 Tax=Streptomyces paludis TaxID=2282738 RepID=A0A345I0T2_9ACTN|nr:histidine phosphatase family protein [Streptomyces paludis]